MSIAGPKLDRPKTSAIKTKNSRKSYWSSGAARVAVRGVKRQTISRHSQDVIGIAVYVGGDLADADANPSITITNEGSGVIVVNAEPTVRDGKGLYSYTIRSNTTASLGYFSALWSYTVGGAARTFLTEYEVVEEQPFWDSLEPQERQLVENVYFRLGDLFDSREGGPYLQDVPQSTFGYETIARLTVTEALPYINLAKPPAFVPGFQVGKGATNKFPEGWHGLLEQGAMWTSLKHLSRSYIEIPDPQNITQGRLDRSRYRQMWAEEADKEKQQLDMMLGQLKRSFRFSTHRALLVAGGMFPNNYARNIARPRWPYVPAFAGAN